MTEISRVALFGKLNSLGYKTIESATVFCKMRLIFGKESKSTRADRGRLESPSAIPINRVNLPYFIGVDRIHRIDRTRDRGFDQS